MPSRTNTSTIRNYTIMLDPGIFNTVRIWVASHFDF